MKARIQNGVLIVGSDDPYESSILEKFMMNNPKILESEIIFDMKDPKVPEKESDIIFKRVMSMFRAFVDMIEDDKGKKEIMDILNKHATVIRPGQLVYHITVIERKKFIEIVNQIYKLMT